MDFIKITIEDKDLFDSYFKKQYIEVSELTFTNLFMWRNYYQIQYAICENLLCIIANPEGAEPFAFMPIGEITKERFEVVRKALKAYFKQKEWKLLFKRVSEEDLTYFTEDKQSENSIQFDRDNSDYVFKIEDLSHLKGKKYDGKRNHINRFKKEHEFEYVALTEAEIPECVRIMQEWCDQRNCEEHRELYCERLVNMELLNNYTKLGCKGALLKVDGRFEAFTVGEALNKDTAVIHIEKANVAIHGLYTLINQQFCLHTWQDLLFVNREQDLGKEGLRKAKLSYVPVKLMNKYIVTVAE